MSVLRIRKELKIIRIIYHRVARWWGSETPEPMKIKFGMIYCIGQGEGTHHAKIGLYRVGVCARRSSEVVRSRVLFLFLGHVYREDRTTHQDA